MSQNQKINEFDNKLNKPVEGFNNLKSFNEILKFGAKNISKSVGEYAFKFFNKDKSSVENYAYIPVGVWLSGSPMLWLQGYTGKNIKIGIIDTGIDPSHRDLTNVKKSFSFVGDEEYRDLHYHGTHVAGTVAANGLIKGVAPGADLYDYRVFDKRGYSTTTSAIANAIIKSADDGCDIINLSFGGSSSDRNLQEAIRYARDKNVLIVVASGNESENSKWNETVNSYPANYSSVLSVGSIDYDIKDGKIGFSNTKFSNRNNEVDVCQDGYLVLSTLPNNNYGVASGTSFSCPHVTGFAALMAQKAKLMTKNTDHTVCDLYTIVKSMTVPINASHLVPDNNIIDIITGAGLVTAFPDIPVKNQQGNFELPNVNIYSSI